MYFRVAAYICPILRVVWTNFSSKILLEESNQVGASVIRIAVAIIPASKEPTLISAERLKLASKVDLKLL